ncbi:hypothetical protein [Cellulomonas shaoxiangyii]|uniref:Uncharacterized protein n=1 Tax=Cellulomonas shaoxiangyii TaxID=2566013 RepID=A0A4P7SPI4_9CELL|nr:hypothetical protein [Cellulomonas shaoxiangyii]QCB94904.1 hypothetical protein E5225_16380 [Cellulomonas shaoxiangyii]TGY79083.1 hypothetical protein E5226_15740 [Cellulomonas shaoxiangyii]
MTAVVVPEVSWWWQWVPPAGASGDEVAAWQGATAPVFAGWAAGGLAALHGEHPGVLRDGLTAAAVGDEVAAWLRGRTDGLPDWTRVAWGAGFVVDDRPQWAPVVATVEFREPSAPDPSYLMDVVATRGRPDDARPPAVDYVTTAAGDGVRVTALVRGPRRAAFVRVDAAMRLDVPATAARPARSADVVLSVRVSELGLFATVGPGVEELMHVVAAQCLPGADGVPAIVLPTVRSLP